MARLRNRYGEVLSRDRETRFVVFDREDGRFAIVEEQRISYDDEEEDGRPIPFPADGAWNEWEIVRSIVRHGIFGTFADALSEAKHIAQR